MATPCWSTASFGDFVHTLPTDLSALEEHLDLCQGSRGRLFALQSAAETLASFVAPRLVTTATVFALLLGIGSLLS